MMALVLKAIFLCGVVLQVVLARHVIDHDRGCIYINGQCAQECPEGTHSYVSPCDGAMRSERTCNNPSIREEPALCDFSRCDCDEPKIRDQTTGECVLVEECPAGYY